MTFILSANIPHRHMSKGQQALAIARAYKLHLEGAVSGRGLKSPRGVASAVAKVSGPHVDRAVAVLQYAEDYADLVFVGDMTLNDAFAVALARDHRS